jgi:hypothetical protein
VVHSYNPSIQDTEPERLRVRGQPELHSETLSQKEKKKTRLSTTFFQHLPPRSPFYKPCTSVVCRGQGKD